MIASGLLLKTEILLTAMPMESMRIIHQSAFFKTWVSVATVDTPRHTVQYIQLANVQ